MNKTNRREKAQEKPKETENHFSYSLESHRNTKLKVIIYMQKAYMVKRRK